MTELRNCPFCGGEAKMVKAKVTACTYGYYVECTSEIPCPCRHPYTECFDTENEAAKAWNGNNDYEIASIFNSIANYNGLQGAIKKWIEHGDKEAKSGVISCPLEMVYPIKKESASKTFEKAYNFGQLQIIWMAAVLMYGSYGTSPRFGWIEDWEKCKRFFYQISFDRGEENDY